MTNKPTVTDGRIRTFTAVSNLFIDCMMPEAGGAFVKIYLYLLRHASDEKVSLAPSAVADVFQCTEKDVLRACRYWEEKGILELAFDESGELSDLRLLDIPESRTDSRRFPSAEYMADGVSEETKGADSGEEQPERNEPAADRDRLIQSISISGDRRQALMSGKDPAVRQILIIAEQYLKRPLNRRDTDTLLYFYDELEFPVDLIDQLLQYCVENRKYSIHYIEKVGLEWYNDGIRTVEDAKRRAGYWNRDYFVILKAFGIHDRVPVSREVDYMKKWLYTYGFSIDLIREACERTVTKTGSPNFRYAEGILSSWKKSSVHSLDDVKRLDEEHLKKSKSGQTRETGAEKPSGRADHSRPGSVSGNRRNNRFNNFSQRKYDYSDLEKQLMKKQLAGTGGDSGDGGDSHTE